MVARSSRSAQTGPIGPVVGLLVLMAMALAGLGGWQMHRLATAYSTEDLAYSQSPRSLQVWLLGLYAQDMAVEERTQQISARLLLMPMPARRQVVISMARPQFWTEMTGDFLRRNQMQTEMLAAVNLALSRAPILGDLWFLSAKLDIDQQGMGQQSLRKLELSGTYAPKAGEIALGRLLVMQLNWPFLDETAKQLMVRDYSHVAAAYPARAEELYRELQALGLDLPLPPAPG